MIIKICLIIILIIAAIQGNAYLFNHVNPWLGVGVSILCVGAALQIAYSIIKNKYIKK